MHLPFPSPWPPHPSPPKPPPTGSPPAPAGLSAGAIAGIVIAVLVVAGLTLAALWFCCIRRKLAARRAGSYASYNGAEAGDLAPVRPWGCPAAAAVALPLPPLLLAELVGLAKLLLGLQRDHAPTWP